MTPLKTKVSLRRLIRLFGYAGIAIVGIAFILSIYGKMTWRHRLLEAEAKANYPTFTPDPEDFETSDLFYRTVHRSYEDRVAYVLKTHIRKPDVIVRGKPKVESGGPSWSLLGGHLDGWWRQRIQWCVRIRFRAERHSEQQFARDLLDLATLDGAQNFDLPARIDHPSSPEEDHEIVTRFGNGVLLAVESTRRGESKHDFADVSWQLAPDSNICKTSHN